ncbi:hypothetical protein RCL49_25230, partial [Salmonella enterica subsp. enterica serovar Typhimurium]
SSFITLVSTPTTSANILSATFTPDYAPNSQEVFVKGSQPSTFFWHVAYTGALQTSDCLEVMANATSSSTYDSSSTVQAQYGSVYVYSASTD